jgi:xylan 1,4-beta-xylosidase
MSANYEIIRYKQGLNTRITIHSVNQFDMHGHKEVELLLVLKGELQLIVNGIRYELKEDDLFFVNSGQMHSTTGQGENIIVAIQVNLEYFENIYPQIKNISFQWPTGAQTYQYQEVFQEIRRYIAQMVGDYRRAEKGYQLAIESGLNSLLLIILRNIPQAQKQETVQSGKDMQRIQNILSYIEEHYTERITLEEVAKQEFMNSYYLSHFFKAKLGISFQEYLNYIRLNKAISLLGSSGENITDIALKSGFANVKSFHNSFRNVYGKTPGEYRRAGEFVIPESGERVAYLEFDSYQALSKLETFLIKERESLVPVDVKVQRKSIFVDCNAKAAKRRNWKHLAAVGRAYDCMRSDLQEQIKLARQELGIEYLRFHGVFSDEMRVVTRNKQGDLVFYWQYIDIVLDFLIKQEIHPILNFTFMPSALASKNITTFWYQGNISVPKSWEEWQELVHQFMLHCINRYGPKEVRRWYFEIWNEPDYMWVSSIEDYFEMYRVTVKAIKSADAQLNISGPSIMSFNEQNLQWLWKFISFINKEAMPLDTFTYHLYGECESILKNATLIPSLGDMDYFTGSVENMEQIMSEFRRPVKEIFITEYNASAVHKNYLSDTMFSACHMIYNFLKNHNRVNGIVPWVLSDIFEEDFELQGSFHGGFGMITLEGIKKPTWYAQWFLSQLGEEVVSQGEDYIVTRIGEDIQILAFSYLFYDKIYQAGDRSLLTYHRRYDVFGAKDDLHIGFDINSLKGSYEKREYLLNRDYGSAYDVFESMGSPKELSLEDVAYLKGMARPRLKVDTITVEDNYHMDMDISPHGIHFILLKKLQETNGNYSNKE